MREALDSALQAVASNWTLGGLALVLATAHFVSEPVRWWIVFRRRNLATLRGYVATFGMTALLSYAMPLKMGLPTRMLLLKRLMKEKAAVVGAVLAIDSLLYYAAWGVSAVLAGALYIGLGPIAADSSSLTIVSVALVVGLFLLSGAMWARRSGFRHKLKSAWSETRGMLRLGIVAWLSVLAIADVLIQGMRHWAIAALLGVSISVWKLIAITVVSVFSGMASFLPLGLGAYDGVLVALLAGESVPVALAALVPIVNRGLSLLVAAILGIWGAADQGIRIRTLRRGTDKSAS